MSERTTPRRIAARIVPIKRLETMPVLRRAAAEIAPPPAPVARTKISGTRLPNSGRFYRPSAEGSEMDRRSVVPGLDDAGNPAQGAADSTGDPLALRENGNDSSLLVFWDQLPTPMEDTIDEPRWISNVELMPDEAELNALGRYLVSMVDGFTCFCCAPGVSESGNWQARLQMPAAVLPDTLLDMSLSPVHVRLRFETQHVVSRRLLERHVATLRDQVSEALAATREVEVELW